MSDPGAQAQAEQTDTHIAEPSAESDTVNSQVTDAVAFTDAATGDATQVAAGSLAQVIAQAAGLAMLNAVNAQQAAYVTANATVLTTVARILGGRLPVDASETAPEKAESHA